MTRYFIPGQDEQYKFTRPEMAKLLGITTNALRMRMRRGQYGDQYVIKAGKFIFKRPRDYIGGRPPVNSSKEHEKLLNEYAKEVKTKQKKTYNRGATHKGEGKYPNEAFKLQNEMKILNNINGKFTSEAHKREFDKLNKEGLKIAHENLIRNQKKNEPLITKNYGHMLNSTGLKKYSMRDTSTPRDNGSFFLQGKGGTKPNIEYEYYSDHKLDNGSVEVDISNFPQDTQPTFKDKVQESIWRLKHNKN